MEEITSKTNELGGISTIHRRENDGLDHSSTVGRTPPLRQNFRESQTNQSINLLVPKTVKIDFPRFDGQSDHTIWLFKAEQFFQLHNIATNDRVSLASFHLEGDAHLWYQLFQQDTITIS